MSSEGKKPDEKQNKRKEPSGNDGAAKSRAPPKRAAIKTRIRALFSKDLRPDSATKADLSKIINGYISRITAQSSKRTKLTPPAASADRQTLVEWIISNLNTANRDRVTAIFSLAMEHCPRVLTAFTQNTFPDFVVQSWSEIQLERLLERLYATLNTSPVASSSSTSEHTCGSSCGFPCKLAKDPHREQQWMNQLRDEKDNCERKWQSRETAWRRETPVSDEIGSVIRQESRRLVRLLQRNTWSQHFVDDQHRFFNHILTQLRNGSGPISSIRFEYKSNEFRDDVDILFADSCVVNPAFTFVTRLCTLSFVITSPETRQAWCEAFAYIIRELSQNPLKPTPRRGFF